MSNMKSILLTGAAVLGLAAPVTAQSLGQSLGADAGVSIGSEAAASTGDTGVSADAGVSAGSSLQTDTNALASGATVYTESTTTVATDGSAALTNSDTTAAIDGGMMNATKVGTLIGLDVASANGEDLGEIDDIVSINGETMAVVGIGGFLGLGEHDVALPVTELMFEGNTVTAMGYTRDQLESMAEFNAELATSLDAEQMVTLGRS